MVDALKSDSRIKVNSRENQSKKVKYVVGDVVEKYIQGGWIGNGKNGEGREEV